jgi:hypothetical protein
MTVPALMVAGLNAGPDARGPFLAMNVLEKVSLLPVMFVIIAVLFSWAAFIRKPDEKRSDHHWRSPRSDAGNAKRKGRFGFWRRHRRRRKERPRNPTLAETGGLPEPRGTDSQRPGGKD